MIELGGVFLAGIGIGLAVDRWIARRLAQSGLGRSPTWRPATRWMLTAALGVGWAAMLRKAGWTWVLPAHVVWVTVTGALVMTDLEHKLIPNRILYPGTAITGVLLLIGALAERTPGRLASAALGALLCLAGMGVLSVLGKDALGMGDVKLSALLGLVCGYRGWEVALQSILSGFLIGGAVAVLLMPTRKAHRHTHVPFSPALVAGAWWSFHGVPLDAV